VKIHWIVLIGLALGLAGGLYYAWNIDPVQYYDNVPDQMAPRYRSRWIRMVAFAYGHTGNLRRAEVQLRHLSDKEIRQELVEALDAAVEDGLPTTALTRMATLAKQYGAKSPAISIYTESGDPLVAATPETPVVPTATPMPPTPSSTSTPIPPLPTPSPTLDPAEFSIAPTATPLAPSYVITEVVRSCLPKPRIAISLTQQISVTDRDTSRLEIVGMPNVEIWLLWSEGADRAITGLHPRQGLGYADFLIEPMTTYNLYIESPTGAPLTALNVDPCETQDEPTWSSWLLTIRSTEIISP
jgi:hypothetical protein